MPTFILHKLIRDKLKNKKFEKKGGFSEGLFVESVEINSDDEWVTYYRKSPEKYKEIA